MKKSTVMQVYLVAFMLVVGLIGYMSFTQPLPTRAPDAQRVSSEQVPAAEHGPPPRMTPVADGEPLALMRIPRFGKDWLWTVFEGDDIETINKGPGHFPETVLPGEEGNASFAAHRATYGDPFLDFDKLKIGDEVHVMQPGAVWTFELTTTPKIISADARWVLDDFEEGSWLTLTTCWPKYGAEKRMYVRAVLTSAEWTG